jgi:RNA polymerase sigma-70 factor (ECF subfamily)
MKGWLFTILRNIWLNELRKPRDGPQLVQIELGNGVADNLSEPSSHLHDLYVSKMETEQVRAAIQKLSEDFREIILLREYEEFSYQEIASIVDCPVGTAMSRLGRARAILKAMLSPTLGDPIGSAPVGIGSSVAPARVQHSSPSTRSDAEERA